MRVSAPEPLVNEKSCGGACGAVGLRRCQKHTGNAREFVVWGGVSGQCVSVRLTESLTSESLNFSVAFSQSVTGTVKLTLW